MRVRRKILPGDMISVETFHYTAHGEFTSKIYTDHPRENGKAGFLVPLNERGLVVERIQVKAFHSSARLTWLRVVFPQGIGWISLGSASKVNL